MRIRATGRAGARAWLASVGVALWATGVHAAVPTVVAGELVGATGVNVGGSVYDMTIAEGTCIDLYGGCDELSDFTFTSLADAQAAAQALFDQVLLDGPLGNFDTVPNLNIGCTGVFCGTAFPYALPTPTDISIVSAVNDANEANDIIVDGDTGRAFDSSSGTFHTLTTYAVWTPVPPATPVVVGGELVGATGVDVGGVLYDVAFLEGTCVDLYDGCDELSDFTFQTLEDAELAARALQDQVLLDGVAGNFDSVPTLTAGCSGAFCGTAFPYGFPSPTEVSVVSAVNQDTEPGDFFGNGPTSRTFDSGSDMLHILTTFAVWTPTATGPPAVPLTAWPAAFPVLVFGLLRLRRLRGR